MSYEPPSEHAHGIFFPPRDTQPQYSPRYQQEKDYRQADPYRQLQPADYGRRARS
jgi:hypothetical protein